MINGDDNYVVKKALFLKSAKELFYWLKIASNYSNKSQINHQLRKYCFKDGVKNGNSACCNSRQIFLLAKGDSHQRSCVTFDVE